MIYFKIQNDKKEWCSGKSKPVFGIVGKVWTDLNIVIEYIDELGRHNRLKDAIDYKIVEFDVSNGKETILRYINVSDINRYNICRRFLSIDYNPAVGNLYRNMAIDEEISDFPHFFTFKVPLTTNIRKIEIDKILKGLDINITNINITNINISRSPSFTFYSLAFKSKDQAMLFRLSFGSAISNSQYLNILEYIQEKSL